MMTAKDKVREMRIRSRVVRAPDVTPMRGLCENCKHYPFSDITLMHKGDPMFNKCLRCWRRLQDFFTPNSVICATGDKQP